MTAALRALLLATAALPAACAEEAPEGSGAPTTAAASGGGTSGPAPTGPWFADVTAPWGLDFVHDAGFSAEKHLPETMGGGAAVLDADGDGDLDLYLVQSGAVVGPAADARRPNRLYLGAGGGSFSDATSRSGAAADRGLGMGVAAGDANGDAAVDLFVTNFGPDRLFLNAGEARFEDASERAGVDDARWTAGATFFDAEGDGDLDLFVAAYLAIDPARPEWCGRREEGWRSYCHPDHYAGLPDRLWRNDGRGVFTDATAAAGLEGSTGKGLGALAFDRDADGDLDLYVANDSVENRLYANDGDGTFVDETLLSGTGVNALGATEAGMGLACGDVDGDLDLDLFVTNLDHESNTLYLDDGGGLFRDGTLASGLEAPSRMPVGFGCLLEDFDQDGHLDLVVANGHIVDNIALYDDAQTWAQRAQAFRGDGAGRFRELADAAGALTAVPRVGRGLCAGDLDGDGDLDLLLTRCGGAAVLLRNDAARGGAFAVVGAAPGARVEVELSSGRRLVRCAGPAPSYLGASQAVAHFGTGGARVVALRIHEPGRPPRDVRLDAGAPVAVWDAGGGTR